MSVVTESLALRCRGLRLSIGERRILDGADLDVAPGEAVAVMGPSGSGKTSLLGCIAGLVQADDGEVEVAGTALTGLSGRARCRLRLHSIGMVFQSGELLDELNVEENVGLPLRLRGSTPLGTIDALRAVGLEDRAGAWPAQLSGGEVQRAAIARAVVGTPALVLADEPTGALDEDSSSIVCDLLRARARASGAGLVVVTHDAAVARRMDRVVRLRHGRLVAA